MISVDLSGKTALVTGGASGIGLATVESFARNGATVALNHLADDSRGAEQVARLKGLGYKIVAAPGNVSQPGEAEAMLPRRGRPAKNYRTPWPHSCVRDYRPLRSDAPDRVRSAERLEDDSSLPELAP